MLIEAKVLESVEVQSMLPENFNCELRDGEFWISDMYLPKWMIYEFLPERCGVQLINNQFVKSPTPSVKHQVILAEIAQKILYRVKAKKSGEVLIGPIDVHFDEKEVFTPDIIFISNERSDIVFENGIYGAPDLIVELLSPSNDTFDLNQKKDIYQKKKVKEYWVIDPVTKGVTGFELNTKGYKALPKTKGIIDSKLLGSSFKF
jgi:Uma2 family endonuclease